MKKKEVIRKELMELMNEYYHGSFAQMVCDYIRCTGMTPNEVKEMLAAIRLKYLVGELKYMNELEN